MERSCLWLDDDSLRIANQFPEVRRRIEAVRKDRLETDDVAVNKLADRPHQFRERKGEEQRKILIPIVSSENREYLPVGLVDGSVVPTNKTFFIGDASLWCLAILSSKLHLAWIAAIAGSFGPNKLDNTFGPQLVYIKAPTEEQGQNAPPSEGLQFFGHVAIDGASEVMTITLKDVEDRSLWSTQIQPRFD